MSAAILAHLQGLSIPDGLADRAIRTELDADQISYVADRTGFRYDKIVALTDPDAPSETPPLMIGFAGRHTVTVDLQPV